MAGRGLLIATCACAWWIAPADGAPVRLTVLDNDTGSPVPCCVYLRDAAGEPVRPRGLPFWRDHFACDGVADLDLAAGVYTGELDRGPEYHLTDTRFTVNGAGTLRVTNRLRRLVNLAKEGWWAGELHVHRPVADIQLLMEAGDLHVAPLITWWNTQNAWGGRAPPANPLERFDGDRYCHLLGGEDERGGGALLFFNLPEPLDLAGANREYPSSMKFLAEAHRQPGVWVDIEKPFWYDVPMWLASGMVDSVGIAHNHMQRAGVLPNEAWGRPRDRLRFPGPQGNGYWTQEIYYHILNCGLRLPPSAGSASGVLPNPVGYDRVYVHRDGALDYARWWAGLKAGQVFVSNGPLLRCRANGQWPGHVFRAPAGHPLSLQLTASLDSRDPIAAIEIVQNGRVVRAIPAAEWRQTQALGTATFSESGWCLVCVIAAVPTTFRFASTGPFYVEIGRVPRRVSRASAQFFLDWVRERLGQIKLNDPRQQDEVLAYQRRAEQFWQEKVAQANAE